MATVQPFDASVDLLRAILWQYNDAVRLQSLLQRKQAWYDENQRDFWTNWHRDVFDLRTANDFGCAVWGAILDISLVIDVPASGSRPVFGFGDFNLNFFDGTFGRDSDGGLPLTLEQKRLVLRLRYYQLISSGCAPEINEFLTGLFAPAGRVYVLDSLDMTWATFVFTFAPSYQVRRVLENFDILPRPAGVKARYLIQPELSFGFAPYYENFNNGNFARV